MKKFQSLKLMLLGLLALGSSNAFAQAVGDQIEDDNYFYTVTKASELKNDLLRALKHPRSRYAQPHAQGETENRPVDRAQHRFGDDRVLRPVQAVDQVLGRHFPFGSRGIRFFLQGGNGLGRGVLGIALAGILL